MRAETLALYERLDEGGRADIELYAAALGHEAAARSLLALRERERERMEGEQEVSRPADSGDAGSSVQPPEEGVTAPDGVVHFYTPGDFRAPLPSLEDALSPEEKAKLDALDSRIRKAFVQGWGVQLAHGNNRSGPQGSGRMAGVHRPRRVRRR